MTILQIEYFLKAAECMSFSEAAKELFVSQPSISKQIQALERELNVTLFDRSNRNQLTLTPAGAVYRDSFRRCEQQLETAKIHAAAIRDRDALLLRVGIGQGWDLSEMLTGFRDSIRERNRETEFRFENDAFSVLHRKLQTGELDVILCTKTSLVNFEELEIRQAASLESRAYARRGALCPAGRELRAEDFDGKELMVLPASETPMAEDIIMLQFLAHRVKPVPKTYPNRDTILQKLLMGEGFAVFDQYMYFHDDPRLTWFTLEDEIPICIVWKKTNSNPLIPLFAEWMVQAFEKGN